MRRRLRAQRRALDPATRAQAAAALARRLSGLPVFRDALHIAGYVAVDGELDPLPLLDLAHQHGKTLYLPVVPPHADGVLGFALWQSGAPLHPNRFGIPEPQSAPDTLRAPDTLDLVLAPLVAFDTHGHRLGMGGGYYDRSFAFLKSAAQKPLLLGLAYEFQRQPALAAESWDVPLAAVVTERRVYRFAD
ncbi:MAG TPA: 5-formyltetrahydrofolate cyclo-ligase [Gammaproteobacteria bacterium]|nr:5-formyltetrahydrofolate cyclo-ligase [Gammaproteobacteria bacterium]